MSKSNSSRLRQFSTVLWKNLLLQTRSRGFCGLGGWTGLLLNIVAPAGIVFMLLCMIQLIDFPPMKRAASTYTPFSLPSTTWVMHSRIPEIYREGKNNTAHVIFAPDNKHVRQIAKLFIQDATCGSAKNAGNYFSHYFFPRPETNVTSLCMVHSHCVADKRCWGPVFKQTTAFAQDGADALRLVLENPGIYDAVIVFDDDSYSSYKLRMNETTVLDPRWLQDRNLQAQYGSKFGHTNFMYYWWFANVQHTLDKAILSFQHGAKVPVDILVSLKPYPDKAVSLDVIAVGMAVFIELALSIAYAIPFRFAITSVVQEKELQLAEGLFVMGLSRSAYWASWACSHILVVATSGTLLALVILNISKSATFFINLLFFWLLAAGLVLYAYCASMFIKSTKRATYYAMLVYVVSFTPGSIAMALQPYGGILWYVACMIPPSALMMFNRGMQELVIDGESVNFKTLTEPLMYGHSFSLSTIFTVMGLSIGLLSALVWYLDKVTSATQSHHPLFFLQPSYWRMQREAQRLQKQQRLGEQGPLLADGVAADNQQAVTIHNLVKTFLTTDGSSVVAVDELSLNFQDRSINALLGHNGAGKTTTIHILTGLLSPSSGTAYIHGLDVRTQMEAIRQLTGICPQFDVLWPSLTVREHLQMYAAIKGFDQKEAAHEAEKAATSVDLVSKLDAWASELSGGQKRKLSVAIAFMGSPRIVFLDEPTSGMDAFTRRFTWDLIRQHKSTAAIVLTTHSMEEADLLSDNISIMSSGQLVAQGTPLQLKNKYGVGYTLSLSLTDPRQADVAGIQQLLQRHVGTDAGTLKQAGAEASAKLPLSKAAQFPTLLRDLESSKRRLGVDSYGLTTTTMEEVFLRVTKGSRLGDDAVTGATNGAASAQSQSSSAEVPTALLPSSNSASFFSQLSALILRRAHPFRRRFLSFLVTRMIYPQVFLVMALCLLRPEWAMFGQSWPAAPITHDRCLGPQPTGLSLSPDVVGNPYAQALKSCFQKSVVLPYHDELSLDLWLSSQNKPAVNDILLLTSPPPPPEALLNGTELYHPTIMFNNKHVAGVPGALNSLAIALQCYLQNGSSVASVQHHHEPHTSVSSSSTRPPHAKGQSCATQACAADAATAAEAMKMQQLLAGHVDGATVTAPQPESTLSRPGGAADARTAEHTSAHVSNHQKRVASTPPITAVDAPLPKVVVTKMGQIEMLSFSNLFLVLSAMAAFAARVNTQYLPFLRDEVSSGGKHMLIISGAHPGTLLLANFLWDFLTLVVTAAAGVGVLAAARFAQLSGVYLIAVAHLLVLGCVAGLAQVYCLQYLVTDGAKASGRLFIFLFIVPMLAVMCKWGFEVMNKPLQWKGWGIPLIMLVDADKFLMPMYHLLLGSLRVMYAYNAAHGDSVEDIVREQTKREDPLAYRFANLGAPAQIKRYMAPSAPPPPAPASCPFIRHRVFKPVSLIPDLQLPQFDAAAVREPCEWMLAQLLIYLLVAFVIEVDVLRVLRAKWQKFWAGSVPNDSRVLDEDVAAEEERVRSGRAEESRILLSSVHKSFWPGLFSRRVHAVKGVSVGVDGGMCFGLLGLNGAGKTTTFKMLTADLLPDAGELKVGQASVVSAPTRVRRQLGYAAQGGGLPRGLTGREVLDIFARLRGTAAHERAAVVSSLITCMDLEKYANRLWESYSGGNKKKLAVAAALVGGPPVVLLDEPSTGMDPAARRFMWTVLQQQVLATGRTVVLTSHSMEECDTLCTRIAIMNEGKLGCLGSSQHLKNRFGQGYLLEVQLQREHEVTQVVEYVISSFPTAAFEVEGKRVVCSIPREQLDLPALFEGVQQNVEAWGVLDYSISQPTLEQVFLTMARNTGQATAGTQ